MPLANANPKMRENCAAAPGPFAPPEAPVPAIVVTLPARSISRILLFQQMLWALDLKVLKQRKFFLL